MEIKSMLDRVRTVEPKNVYNDGDEREKVMNQIYGYEDMTEEQKQSLLMQFLQYVRESKERDRARLQQTKML